MRNSVSPVLTFPINYIALLAKIYFLVWSATTPITAQAYYTGVPAVLPAISHCESSDQQWDANGKVLTSKTSDYGIFQINIANIPEAKKLGLDIKNSKEDNIKFALLLYKEHGTSPWNGSKSCWSKYVSK